MLYDLNITWAPSTPAAELERTLRFAKNLGYDVVALNHTVNGSIPTQPSAIINPIPLLTPPHPSFPGGSSTTTTNTTTATLKSGTTTNLSTTASSAAPPAPAASLPTVLRRATVVVTDPATTNYRLPDFARAYDLLAVRPTNEKAFSWACLSTTEPPALISLDLSAFLGWHIHHRTAMAAVARGSRFEICYGQALGGAADPRLRANFIGNVIGLLRATKGRGIVVSSGAKAALGLRAPADVVNLLAVWGLGTEKGAEALGAGARAVVVNEGIKRRGFRGVVDIVEPAAAAGGDDAAGRKEGGANGSEGETAGGVKGKKNKQNGKPSQGQQGEGQAQKRKNGESAAQPNLSKRQAKKQKQEAIDVLKATA
ncbi:RNase P subunit p30-domain-containing protein [Podospora appendiculata]|uniref:RNase P subunit p30-domain-containing protein n=1 Tax=Podospora appendiculata TaxID=314037 RepID=A0AAE0XKU5_9PEZI|nr:RNase P subunit p30-domain-containing protein [Podospora appendiculata]